MAQAEPTEPMAGKPRFPKTSIQSRKTLSRLVRTIATTSCHMRCIDCSTKRIARNTRKPGIPSTVMRA